MNHSGIGRIDEKGNLYLSSDLLSPLSIVDDVVVWGMYYPHKVENYKDGMDKIIKHDFVLSPIPFDMWGRVGRIKLRIKNKANVLKLVTDIISKKGGSILISEFSRSAHSYDTWTIVLVFEDIGEIHYEEENKRYQPVYDCFNDLVEEIENKCKYILYSDEKDPTMGDLVRWAPYSALSYFYNVASKDKNDFNLFTLRCKKNGMLKSKGGKFLDLLNYISPSNTDSILPCKVFAELETKDINIRAALILKEEEKKFFRAKVSFSRSGPGSSSGGFVNYVLSSLSDYSVWRMANRTIKYTKSGETGSADLVLRDTCVQSNLSRKSIIQSRLDSNDDYRKRLSSVNIECDSLGEMYRYNRENWSHMKNKYDVFISYCSRNREQANILYDELSSQGYHCYKDDKVIKGGDYFSDGIRDALRESREVVLLYSNHAKNSDWVRHEYGAAWALGKRVTPVAINMEVEDLPSWLKKYQAFSFSELDKLIVDLNDR